MFIRALFIITEHWKQLKGKWMKNIMVYSYKAILFSNKKENYFYMQQHREISVILLIKKKPDKLLGKKESVQKKSTYGSVYEICGT